MATRRKGLPYLYATWLSKVLAAEKPCLYSPWFRARFTFQKFEEDAGDLVEWNRKHTKLMEARQRALERAGYTCRVEEDNAFRLDGRTAVIAGKMDLVARKDDHLLIVDGKTGRERDSDVWQVLLYLWAAPRIWNLEGIELEGEVHYTHGEVSLSPAELTEQRVAKIVNLVKVLADDVAPPKTPTRDNCRFCTIGPIDCPQRVMKQQVAAVAEF